MIFITLFIRVWPNLQILEVDHLKNHSWKTHPCLNEALIWNFGCITHVCCLIRITYELISMGYQISSRYCWVINDLPCLSVWGFSRKYLQDYVLLFYLILAKQNYLVIFFQFFLQKRQFKWVHVISNRTQSLMSLPKNVLSCLVDTWKVIHPDFDLTWPSLSSVVFTKWFGPLCNPPPWLFKEVLLISRKLKDSQENRNIGRQNVMCHWHSYREI